MSHCWPERPFVPSTSSRRFTCSRGALTGPSQVRRVHRVGIVVEGVRVLDLDEDHPGIAGGGPVLVELVRGLLPGPVVAVDAEALAPLAGKAGIGRLFAESPEVAREVPVEDHE